MTHRKEVPLKTAPGGNVPYLKKIILGGREMAECRVVSCRVDCQTMILVEFQDFIARELNYFLG